MLVQRPRLLIIQAGILAAAAVVAAPILKLCEAYWDWSSAAELNNEQRALFREACVKGANLPAMKTGSAAVVLLEKGIYSRKARTGQVDVLVGYTWTWWPFRKGSVLDCLRLMVILLL